MNFQWKLISRIHEFIEPVPIDGKMSFGKPLIHSPIEMNGREKASTAFGHGFDDRLRGLLTSERPSFAIVLFVSTVASDVRHSMAGKLVLTALPMIVNFFH